MVLSIVIFYAIGMIASAIVTMEVAVDAHVKWHLLIKILFRTLKAKFFTGF